MTPTGPTWSQTTNSHGLSEEPRVQRVRSPRDRSRRLASASPCRDLERERDLRAGAHDSVGEVRRMARSTGRPGTRRTAAAAGEASQLGREPMGADNPEQLELLPGLGAWR